MHSIMLELLHSDPSLEKHQFGLEHSDQNQVLSLSSVFPPSYIDFVNRYGGTKLFRRGNGYLLIVLSLPLKVDGGKAGVLYQFGSYDDAKCYFKQKLMKQKSESPVFAFEGGSLVRVAKGFGEWFTNAVAELINQDRALPSLDTTCPFTDEEKRILEIRKGFNWLVVERTHEHVVINVTNSSDSNLDCFTLGVRSKDRTLNGAVRVDVKDLAPGMSTIISLDCYSDLVAPEDVDLFDLPNPTPAKRSCYFELRCK